MMINLQNLESNPARILNASGLRPVIWASIGQIEANPPLHFYSMWLSREMGQTGHMITPNNILRETNVLEDLEMIKRLPSHEALRVVLFQRLNVEPWEWVSKGIVTLGIEVPSISQPPQIQI